MAAVELVHRRDGGFKVEIDDSPSYDVLRFLDRIPSYEEAEEKRKKRDTFESVAKDWEIQQEGARLNFGVNSRGGKYFFTLSRAYGNTPRYDEEARPPYTIIDNNWLKQQREEVRNGVLTDTLPNFEPLGDGRYLMSIYSQDKGGWLKKMASSRVYVIGPSEEEKEASNGFNRLMRR